MIPVRSSGLSGLLDNCVACSLNMNAGTKIRTFLASSCDTSLCVDFVRCVKSLDFLRFVAGRCMH